MPAKQAPGRARDKAGGRSIQIDRQPPPPTAVVAAGGSVSIPTPADCRLECSTTLRREGSSIVPVGPPEMAMATSAAAAAPCAPAASLPSSSSSPFKVGVASWPRGSLAPRLVAASSSTGRRWQVVRAAAGLNTVVQLPLTTENVESILDEVRPYLIADGGDVALHEIDGNVVRLKLQGACRSCPSSMTTMKMSIQRRLMENIPEISAVERVTEKEMGLMLNEANVQKLTYVEILKFASLLYYKTLRWTAKSIGDSFKPNFRLTGRAAGVKKTLRAALTQRLREKIPSIAAIRVSL
ncbi:hypothetical protein U9M48_035146 [Paspalum notatum var. saurae]|uniref:NIF system FeS cluster assembly NifU C-terminal domain-containing protein n=1 Tax=Paspalum notatum var. saurae TaxID=547442 RepID=A0AAQ3UBI3_PASNO